MINTDSTLFQSAIEQGFHAGREGKRPEIESELCRRNRFAYIAAFAAGRKSFIRDRLARELASLELSPDEKARRFQALQNIRWEYYNLTRGRK
jgi:hypothetical protein